MAEQGINILSDKYTQLREWLNHIAQKKGVESELSVEQIFRMLDFLDTIEKRMDDIILKIFREYPNEGDS